MKWISLKLTQSHHRPLFLFEDICLKETMSLADSLYNLQLIQEFCQEYLNQCCHFTLEDMLYAASSIKVNEFFFPLLCLSFFN